MIAALYVLADGPYAGIEGVDLWPESRDARLYAGPWPVVAHPPCARWGRYWSGGPSARVRRIKGDDGGCFAAALKAVTTWGGVLEHPAHSSAWAHFGLPVPARLGWHRHVGTSGWSCHVEQGNYGHPARKATWLYAVGCELPRLHWGKAPKGVRLDEGYHSADERRRAIKTGICQRLSARQCALTPIPFRDLLLSLARSVTSSAAATGCAPARP